MSRSEQAKAESSGSELASVLSEIARALQSEPDVGTTLVAIVKTAVDHVEGCEDAGISLVERGSRVRTVAPTSEIVKDIDDLQYRTRQGPCLDAIAHHKVFLTGDLSRETRWPDFSAKAASMGVRSMLSYRLFVTDTTLGALNLYSSHLDAFSDETAQDGSMFAAHAAIALIGVKEQASLLAALETRDVIGMAKGVLMERHGVNPAQAFRLLVEASQAANMKLHNVATWLVEQRTK